MFELIRAKASRQGKPVGEGITCKQAKNWLAGSKGGKADNEKDGSQEKKNGGEGELNRLLRRCVCGCGPNRVI
jgi:hypothetical protein